MEIKSEGGEKFMFELIFLVVMGLVFCYIGWRVWKKEQITLIHGYHYKKVSESNRKPYTEQIGKALVIIGIGLTATGIIDYFSGTLYGWVCFVVCFIIALIKMCKAQKRYNGSWF